MPTKEEIMAEIEVFKNAKGTLVQDSLIRILNMLCEVATAEDEETEETNEDQTPAEETPGT